MEAIKSAVEAFVRGGDNRDVAQLERILHPAFQNIQDGFFDEKGIFVISKTNYIELVKTKKFGGNPRSIEFVHVEQMGNIALVKAILESQYLKFHSTILCVCENDRWQIISNAPKIEVK